MIDNISDAPDFALISEDKTKIYLVEVKYQKNSDNFYCASCSSVLNNARMSELSENWAAKERQAEYLSLLKGSYKANGSVDKQTAQ